MPNFEKEFGVKVTYDTYESNEEMVAKLQAGATGYDIIVPSGYIIPVLVATDLIDSAQQEVPHQLGQRLAHLPEPAHPIPAAPTPCPGSGAPAASPTAPTR